jgi:hypothetical protein
MTRLTNFSQSSKACQTRSKSLSRRLKLAVLRRTAQSAGGHHETVVARREHGDLAEAVRTLSAAIGKATGIP